MAGGYIARHHLPWKMKEEEIRGGKGRGDEEPEVLGASGERRRRICLFE